MSRNGQLRDPDVNKLLESAARTPLVARYRDGYANQPSNTYAFLPCVMSTSGRIHGDYMRICLISELPLVQWAISIHTAPVGFDVPRRLWIPNFLFETADLASIFALYYGADADEVWYPAFLFAEFCFNLIIFRDRTKFLEDWTSSSGLMCSSSTWKTGLARLA